MEHPDSSIDESRFGDMPIDDFRRHGHQVVEWIARYLEAVEAMPVLSRSSPGEVSDNLRSGSPGEPISFEAIFSDFDRKIIPGITHWNHPAFFGYFGTSASGPAILAEMLAAALNVNAMLWRTSPAATEVEELSTGWLREMLGLPDAFRGHIQDTASTSTMVAMAAAREAAEPRVRETGLAASDIPALRVYCSEEAHSSVQRAAITLGLGRTGIRRIPTDEVFRMRIDLLARAIEDDIEQGARPICVVATLGTTSTTSVDPIAEIAEICRKHRIWLHVDAAYAGAAAIVPGLRHLHRGWEHADSIVVNPHKWLFVPIDCSVLFLKNPEIVRRAFALEADYLETSKGDTVTNLMEYGPALGRRFRSLKLWTTLRYFGKAGLAARIGEHVRLAGLFRRWVEEEPGWAIAAPSPFSTVCFRFVPSGADGAVLDRINEAILDRVNADGGAFLSHTRLHGRFTLRLAIGNIRSTEVHVRRAWDLLRREAVDLA